MLGLEEIIGLEVISSDARVVGTVEGVGVDLLQWKVPALSVGLRRGVEDLAGIKKRPFSVEKVYMRTQDLEAISDTVIMKLPLSSVGETIYQEQETVTPAGSLMGMRVILRNARYIGMVDNMLFDPAGDWSIPYLQVKPDRSTVEELNMSRSFMTSPLVPVRTADIRAIGDMVMMGIDMGELKESLRNRGAPSGGPPPPPPGPPQEERWEPPEQYRDQYRQGP